MKITLRVFRFDPSVDEAPYYRNYSVEAEPYERVLDCLNKIKWEQEELLLPFIGGIFVIEALSVILQVGSYKLRKKRIFKMAPIHHHFELLGWSESKVIVRFWIASLVFALFALTTLKLR